MNECIEWLHETRKVFPKLNKEIILSDYKKIRRKVLGFVRAKIEQKIDFNPEALILGNNTKIKEKKLKPKEFYLYINQDLQRIKNIALRKEIIQNIMIHELLHIENKDLITLSKKFSRRKKKRIHVKEFEEEVFQRYNQLRKIKGIMQIEKKEHLNTAINKILDSINWFKK